MSDLSPETRDLLDQARDGDRLPAGRRALLESKFFARVAGGMLVGFAAGEAFAKSAGLFGPVAKGLAGLALVSSIGAGGYMAVRASRYDVASSRATSDTRHAANPPNDLSAPAAQVITAPPARAPRASEPLESRRASSNMNERETTRRTTSAPSPAQLRASARGSAPLRSAPAPVAAAAPAQTAPAAASPPAAPEPTAPTPEEVAPVRAPSTLADETRLLWEADQALRSGNTARAVALLDEHATRFPDGALGPERGAERVVALCKLGRIDAATVRGYLNSHPNLSLSDRIQQACSRILSRK